ncbi:isoprenylcysteine carboxylmethyltransferase family protein [Desulfobacterota bacterium AH_259_B03_O07]|nr:isoprenylcysteine carboxylmethyltransferase family protein [Desulfobacterota bacterium AH_259_B03_O07]
MDPLLITTLLCLFAYWLTEPLMRRGQAREFSTTQFEHHTTALVNAVAIGGVLAALAIRLFGVTLPAEPSPTVGWLLLALLGIGVILRYWSMAVLGELFTRTLRITSGHNLVQSGPYRWVRHPGYLASIFAHGLVATLLAPSLLLGSAVGVALGFAYAYRIHHEEEMLVSVFGESYREYQERTWRLIPWVY